LPDHSCMPGYCSLKGFLGADKAVWTLLHSIRELTHQIRLQAEA
jgi:hypothetical protein